MKNKIILMALLLMSCGVNAAGGGQKRLDVALLCQDGYAAIIDGKIFYHKFERKMTPQEGAREVVSRLKHLGNPRLTEQALLDFYFDHEVNCRHTKDRMGRFISPDYEAAVTVKVVPAVENLTFIRRLKAAKTKEKNEALLQKLLGTKV